MQRPTGLGCGKRRVRKPALRRQRGIQIRSPIRRAGFPTCRIDALSHRLGTRQTWRHRWDESECGGYSSMRSFGLNQTGAHVSEANTWSKYLTDYNEGLGLVYERFVLNDFLDDLRRRHNIQSVLEAPLYGMAGVSGINDVDFARKGVSRHHGGRHRRAHSGRAAHLAGRSGPVAQSGLHPARSMGHICPLPTTAST